MTNKSYLLNFISALSFLTLICYSNVLVSQDINMQDGSFNRCSPDRFFDSGGEFSTYASNENSTLTICPENPGEIIVLNFTRFSTQAPDSTNNIEGDVMIIYDGDSVASNVIGEFFGTTSPRTIASSDASGCLTINFTSDGFGNAQGWQASIDCATPCQTITPSIDNTLPATDPVTNQIAIIPGQTVQFDGSAIFSDSDVNAEYFWNFGTGGTANTQTTSHQFINSGLFIVEFTVSDDNPLGCSESVSVSVLVGDPIVSINSPAFPESSLSLPELIDEVLVSGGCADIQLVSQQVFGQPDDLQTKSYGFFRNGGTDFPFESGIVLTSGNAFLGGNTFNNQIIQSTAGNNEPGDTDLEDALGITNTNDATFIEFNFIPTTDRVDFNYILASEEYDGATECSFADGFAFILTRPDGTTDNLAVLPNGTVVNVTNINQSAACGANQDFFAGYNLGATNYNGRTEVLTASATGLEPNETYVMKLVVADQGDQLFDTAIFIEAGSFNLGGELGDDLTLAAGTASCGGQTVTLDTQARDAIHTWSFNGNPIAGAGTGSTLEVTEAGVYSVFVEFAPGCSTQDSIIVEFRTSPEIIASPIDLAGCSPSGIAEFNLEQNTPLVFGVQNDTEFAITYHNSLADAETGDNPIPNLNNYSATDGEVIFVRIDDIATEQCVVIDSFLLSVFSSVSSEDVVFELCDSANDGDDTNGIADFDLSLIDSQVLGTQDPTQFTVSYHANQNDADTGDNPLPSIISNGAQSVIFARVQNNNNVDCYATSTITLQVNALPSVVSSVDLRQCDVDTDGLSEFNLTEANDLISTNSVNETFTYYETLVDAQNETNSILNELTYPNTDSSANPDILFVRVENANTCSRIAQLELFVSTSQIPTGFVIPTYEECDDTRVDDNISDGVTTFDFSDATSQIEAIFPAGQNITVTYYETTADALAETNPILDISNHINTASPFSQTITYRVDNNTDNSCQGLGEFQLRVINPTPRTDIDDLIACDDMTIGDLSEEFDLTQNEAFVFDGNPTLSASYFLSFNDALNNVLGNEITLPSAYNNVNPTETIFVRVEDTNTNCFTVVDFDIVVNPLPEVVAVSSILECENGTDGFFDFDLGQKRDEILNGQDPSQFTVSFHISQTDADNLSNPQPDIFINSVNPQEIFYAITNNVTSCSNSSGSFFIEVLEGAQANSDGEPLDFELCDDNIENDGVAQFDLATLEGEILDGQEPEDYTITFHFSQQNALDNIEPLPLLYENLTNPQFVWVRVSNNISPDVCFEVQEIPLRVNPIPEFDLEDVYVLCTTFNGTEVVPVPPILDTRLSSAYYSFEWRLDGEVITSETQPILIPAQGGTYTVEVTDITTSNLTRCTNMDVAVVIESEIPIVVAEVTSQAFSGNHIIEAITANVGDFEFSLDNGPWQDTGFFDNVTPGTHTVYARDIDGCGIGSDTVLVIDYPLYFTPNGDGNHDTWNIVGIDTQPSAKIYIFDRYGKLLKQLSPTGSGWDGTYQGNRMPTDDYWFTVEYTEPTTGERKEQRAHFTLKR